LMYVCTMAFVKLMTKFTYFLIKIDKIGWALPTNPDKKNS